MVWVEKELGDLVPLPCLGQGHLPLSLNPEIIPTFSRHLKTHLTSKDLASLHALSYQELDY